MSMRRVLELVESRLPTEKERAAVFLKAKKAGKIWSGSTREIDPYGNPAALPVKQSVAPSKKVSLDGVDDVDWEIYKPFPDDSPEERAKYKDWRKVSSALSSAANKAVTQTVKGVAALMRSSDLDEYDDEEEIASSIAGMISKARKSLFIPVAEKYDGYGIYDGEVERQWRDIVINRVLSAAKFSNKSIKDEIIDNM